MAQYLDRADPAVIVTLGSFIGAAVSATWQRLADAVRAAGVHAVFVGASGAAADEVLGGRPDITRTAFVPLSKHLDHAAVLVHHGGIGTTFAAARAGVASVVVPQAFDQTFNGRLVEAAGLGASAERSDLAERLTQAVSGRFDAATAAVSDQLVTSGTATAELLRRIDGASDS